MMTIIANVSTMPNNNNNAVGQWWKKTILFYVKPTKKNTAIIQEKQWNKKSIADIKNDHQKNKKTCENEENINAIW